MREKTQYLVLNQYRTKSVYNDFIGKFYHFPGGEKKSYLKFFENLPIEFVYYEPEKEGKGEYFGFGRIIKPPFKDKREKGHYFVEISDYKPFNKPVYFKGKQNKILEKVYAPKFYNAQNAVRRTTEKFIEEISLDGGIQLNFKVDSHLVQVLGEQLIASERVGILELVKNSFDAGATYCDVRIEKIPNLKKIPEKLYTYDKFEGPVIAVVDDGSGMSMEQIENGWLRPASVIKTNVKERLKNERRIAVKQGKLESFNRFVKLLKKEHKNRIPLGEKGVGRFATHRLGKYLRIITKTKDRNYEYVLDINWDEFHIEEGFIKDLDSVGVTLTRQDPTGEFKSGSGTKIIIYGGREGFELTEEEVKAINNSILQINSPNPNPSNKIQSFKTFFHCPQVKDLDEKIDYLIYDPVFIISGNVDEKGIFKYDYIFEPPYNIPLTGFIYSNEKLDLKPLHSNKYWQAKNNSWRIPTCGSFYFYLQVWYRDTPWVSKTEKDFLKYLRNYGGISVFRDGIKVLAAEIGVESDWLGLRQRQIEQAYRMSYYHMLGNIEIDQTNNIDLIDKTNREGMIKNQAYNDLVELVKTIIFFVEKDYIGKRDEFNKLRGKSISEPHVLKNFSQNAAKVLLNIHDNYDIQSDPYKLLVNLGRKSERKGNLVELSKSLKNLKENLQKIEEVQDMLKEQAGFGLGIATALHEITKTTSNFYYGIVDVLKSGRFNKIKLEDLKDTSRALESEINRLSPLRALRNEEPVKLNVSKSISYVHSLFKQRFEDLNIKFNYNKNVDFQIIARFGALNQILTNLLDNSCYWLDNPDIKDRRININIDSENRTIIVADSGRGIAESILPYLFQPGYSLKIPPSGLGLYICKHYMNLMKKRGDIYLAKEKDRINNLRGAQFLLDFSNVNEKSDEEE